jgi:hypothetical protein
LSCTSSDTPTNMTGTWRWSTRLHIRSTVFGAVAAAVMSSAMAQSPVTAYGYSRATLPGIPGDQKGTQGKDMFPPRYYLYVEVKPGSRVSAEWVWIRGSYYDCKLARVSTPVLVESDPGIPTEKKETLVSKTSNEVYSVVLGDVKVRTASNGQERELVANNEAVIALVINKSSAYGAVQSIEALRPAAAM